MNKGICIHEGCCSPDLLITDFLVHGDIGLNSSVIEEGILQDQTDICSQLFLTVGPNIHTIQENSP
ncbi:Uncharacterised protein [Streptococcus pneumoniae]|nr:Uncharacterised protein [Streptococcus pneumoniae]